MGKNQKNIVYMYLIGLDSLFDWETDFLIIMLYISLLVFALINLFDLCVFSFLFDWHSEIYNKLLNISKFLFNINTEFINYG